jgi:hypothetical protein
MVFLCGIIQNYRLYRRTSVSESPNETFKDMVPIRRAHTKEWRSNSLRKMNQSRKLKKPNAHQVLIVPISVNITFTCSAINVSRSATNLGWGTSEAVGTCGHEEAMSVDFS